MKTTNVCMALALIGAVQVPVAGWAAVDVVACGQFVKGTGDLVADLDCSGQADDAVKLQGKLRLHGFTLRGNPGFDVVRCDLGSCIVEGPGTVTGGLDGVRSNLGAKVVSATVTGNGGDGVRSDHTAKAADSTISGNGGDGIRSKGAAVIMRSTITGNGSDGVHADGSVRVKESAVSGNDGSGVDSGNVVNAKLTQAIGNGHDGLLGLKVKLRDSTATGNGVSSECGTTDNCADIASATLPKVLGTSTCNSSRNTELGGSWGVCNGM